MANQTLCEHGLLPDGCRTCLEYARLKAMYNVALLAARAACEAQKPRAPDSVYLRGRYDAACACVEAIEKLMDAPALMARALAAAKREL